MTVVPEAQNLTLKSIDSKYGRVKDYVEQFLERLEDIKDVKKFACSSS